MTDDFFAPPTATTTPASGGDFFAPASSAATSQAPATVSSSNPTPAQNAGGGFFSSMGSALSSLEGKIGGLFSKGSAPMQAVPPSIPQNNAKTPDFFSAPVNAPSVSSAVASVGKNVKSSQTGLENFWEGVKNDFTAKIPMTNGTISATDIPALSRFLPQQHAVPSPDGKPSLSEGGAGYQTANSFQDFLSHIGLPTSVVKNPVTDAIGNSFDTAVGKTTSAIENLADTNTSPTKKVGTGLDAAGSLVGLLYSPISAAFNIGEGNKITKPLVDTALYPLKLISQGIGIGTTKIMNALPISQEAKDNLTAPISDTLSLIAQIYAGDIAAEKGIPMVKDKIADIRNTLNQNIVMNAIAHTDTPEGVASILKRVNAPQETIDTMKEPLSRAKTVAEVRDVLTGNAKAAPAEADVAKTPELTGKAAQLPKPSDIRAIAESVKGRGALASVKGEPSGVATNSDLVPQSKNIVPNQSFRTLDMGSIEGTPENAQTKAVNKERILAGNVPMGENGTGETFNAFQDRVLPEFRDILDTAKDGTTVVTHSSVLKLMKQWDGQGRSANFRVDPAQYNGQSTETGDLEKFKGANGNVFVARHGQTEDNVAGNFRSADTNLTDKGVSQANETAAQLKAELGGKTPPQIITSDLPRAIHTSNILNTGGRINNIAPEIEALNISDEQKNALQAIQEGDTSKETIGIADTIPETEIDRLHGSNIDTYHRLIDTMGNARSTEFGTNKPADIKDIGGNEPALPGGEPGIPVDKVSQLAAGKDAGNGIGDIFVHNARTAFPESEIDERAIKQQRYELFSGKSLKIDDNLPITLAGLGFPDKIVSMLPSYGNRGAFDNFSFTDPRWGKKTAGGYFPEGRTLKLNPRLLDHPTYVDGSILPHEATHAMFDRLPRDQKVRLHNRIEATDAPSQAWKISGLNTYNWYYNQSVQQVKEAIIDSLKGGESVGLTEDAEMLSNEAMRRAGFETGKVMFLPEFLEETRSGLSEKIGRVNAILKDSGRNPIRLNAEDTAAVHENVAMVGEFSGELKSDDPVVQKFITQTNGNGITYGNQEGSEGFFSRLSGDDRTPQEILADAEAKALEPKQPDRIRELDRIVSASPAHADFTRSLAESASLRDSLPELNREVQDIGYDNLTDYYVKNKIISNAEKGIVPQRIFAKPKAIPVTEIKKIRVSNKDVPMSEENRQTLDTIRTQRGILQDMVAEHPGKALEKFVSRKEGVFEDFRDPMSAKTPSERRAIEDRNRKITDAAENAFDGTQYRDQFDNPDVIRQAIEDFRVLKESLNETIQVQRAFINEEKMLRNFTKDAKALEREARRNAVKEMPKSVSDVNPPEVRGGMKAPKLNLEKWKDSGWMARESLDRNIEKVAPREDAKIVNEFLGDHLRKNATDEIEYINRAFSQMGEKMKELGLKKGSRESSLIQKYGEGLISISELQKESPDKWKEISSASTEFQNVYDRTIDDWNAKRKPFGYPDVPKLKNYFPHFKDISFWTKTYGFLNSNDSLPTSIAGKTEFFKPGKTYTPHEQRRTGRETKYDAIEGMEIYVRSVAKQMFTIDSIQRGKALDKYITRAAQVGEALGTPLKLSDFQTNLQEVIYNQLAGKTGGLDRNIEKFGKRPVIKAILAVSKLVGKNIIAFNPATALTHLVSMPLNAATVGKVPFIKGLMTTVSSPFSSGPFYEIDGQRSDFLYRRYPEQHIMSTKFESIEEAGGWMLKQMDIFKTRTAVASKYYELVDKGMSPESAIKQADIYAGRIHGDYSRGQKPIIMNQKLVSVLAQFQFGMNDAISVLTHDIPYQNSKEFKGENGETFTKNEYVKQVWKYAQWAVYAYLLNLVLTQIKGSGKGLDPIGLSMTLAGADTEGQGKTVGARIGLAAKDLAGEIPFGNLIVGNSPTASAFSQPIKDAIAGNLLKSGIDVGSLFLSPIGGGSQVVKTVTGAQAIARGEATTIAQKAQALFFGPKTTVPNNKATVAIQKSLKAAQTKVSNFDPAEVAIVQPIFDSAKAAGFGTPEADALVQGLNDSQYKIYRAMKVVDADQGALDLESKVLPIVNKAAKLGFGTPEADKLVNDSFPETPEGSAEYSAYSKLKTSLYGTGSTPTPSGAVSSNATADSGNTAGPGTSTWDKQNLIQHVVNISKALGTDPVTTFRDIFGGDYKITGLANGQVIVNRNSLKEASEKKALGGTSAMTLDHAVSLSLGGTNQTSNMWLIPKDQAAEDDKVEFLLGSALNSGKITGKEAQTLELRYKKGADAAFIDDRTKKLFENVGDPMTADEVRQLVSSK